MWILLSEKRKYKWKVIENTKFQKVWFQIKQEKQNKQLVINLGSEQQAEERGACGRERKSPEKLHEFPRTTRGKRPRETTHERSGDGSQQHRASSTSHHALLDKSSTILRLSSLQLPFFPASFKLFLTNKKSNQS